MGDDLETVGHNVRERASTRLKTRLKPISQETEPHQTSIYAAAFRAKTSGLIRPVTASLCPPVPPPPSRPPFGTSTPSSRGTPSGLPSTAAPQAPARTPKPPLSISARIRFRADVNRGGGMELPRTPPGAMISGLVVSLRGHKKGSKHLHTAFRCICLLVFIRKRRGGADFA